MYFSKRHAYSVYSSCNYKNINGNHRQNSFNHQCHHGNFAAGYFHSTHCQQNISVKKRIKNTNYTNQWQNKSDSFFIHFPNLMSPRLKIIKGYIIISTRPVTLYFGKEVTIQTYKTVTNSFASACMLFRKIIFPSLIFNSTHFVYCIFKFFHYAFFLKNLNKLQHTTHSKITTTPPTMPENDVPAIVSEDLNP